MTKWCSNNRNVFQSIPLEGRAKELNVIQLEKEDLPNKRALGIQWIIEEDRFCFNVAVRTFVPTRRHILSNVSSVFDPIGFLSPFVLTAKLILHDWCRRGIFWDDKLEDDMLKKWQHWLSELERLNQVKIDRFLKTAGFGKVTGFKIHHFADASNYSFGVVSYVRFTNVNQDVYCALILSKSRVNPPKKATIPSIDIFDGTLAVHLQKRVADPLNLKWTKA